MNQEHHHRQQLCNQSMVTMNTMMGQLSPLKYWWEANCKETLWIHKMRMHKEFECLWTDEDDKLNEHQGHHGVARSYRLRQRRKDKQVLEQLEWYKHWRSASPNTLQLVVHLLITAHPFRARKESLQHSWGTILENLLALTWQRHWNEGHSFNEVWVWT